MEDVGAAIRDGLLKADVPLTASAGFSVGLLILANISVDDVEGGAGAGLDELAFWAPPRLKRLEAVVVGVVDSAGLDVRGGKLNDGFDAFDAGLEIGLVKRDGALVWADEADVVDCPPRFWKRGFGASALAVFVVEGLLSFCFPKLLKSPAVGCASGLLPKIFDPEFSEACGNKLVLDCEEVVGLDEFEG